MQSLMPLFKKERRLKAMTIGSIVPMALAMVILIFVVSIGSTILDNLQDQQVANEEDYNVTQSGLEAMGTFGDWFGIIVIVVVAACVIGLLISQFRVVGAE